MTCRPKQKKIKRHFFIDCAWASFTYFLFLSKKKAETGLVEFVREFLY